MYDVMVLEPLNFEGLNIELTACLTGFATNPYMGFFRHAFRSSESRVVAIPDILNPDY